MSLSCVKKYQDVYQTKKTSMQNAIKNPIVAGLVAAGITMVAKMIDDKFITKKKSGTWKQYVKCGLFVGLLVTVIVYAVITPMGTQFGGGNNPVTHPATNPVANPLSVPVKSSVPTGLLRDPF